MAPKLVLQNLIPSDTFDIVVSELSVELEEVTKLEILIVLPSVAKNLETQFTPYMNSELHPFVASSAAIYESW